MPYLATPFAPAALPPHIRTDKKTRNPIKNEQLHFPGIVGRFRISSIDSRSMFCFRIPLPLHLVGLVASAQAEGAGKVACQQINLLNAGDQSLVDSLLVSSTRAVDFLLL